MHNRLIFRYHRVRVHPNIRVAKGLSSDEPTHPAAGSKEGTQEGR